MSDLLVKYDGDINASTNDRYTDYYFTVNKRFEETL